MAKGFATMDPAALREIARKGGIAAHKAGTAHKFTSEEARIAGMKSAEGKRRKLREDLQKEDAERRKLAHSIGLIEDCDDDS